VTEHFSPGRPPRTAGEFLRFEPVRRYLLSTFALYTGVALQAATLYWQVYDISGREADLGFLGLAEFLPAALLVLVTGSVSDRFDRRHVAIVASFGELVGALALMAYALTDPTSTLPLFAVAFWFGVSRAFQAPAIRAMPPMVAPEGGLPRTIALSNATWTAAIIIGPVTSGFLIAIDPWVAYAVAASLVLIGWLSLFRIRFVRRPEPPDPAERPSLRSAVEGLRFIRRTPVLLAAVSLDLFAVLLGGAMALLPVIAEEQLGVGQVGYGWLRAAPGIGAALMALWLAARPVQRRVGPTLLWTVAVFGLGTVTLGLTASFAVAFISLLVIHAADMVSVLIRGSLVPLVTPDEKRGRVLAVENVFIGASNELGAFRSGVLAQAVGAQATVVGGGLATLVVVGLWSLLFPSLRRVDRFDELDVGSRQGS
jgi:MFS family permease